MFGTIFLTLALVAICYKWFKKDAHKRSRLPPGPPSYPLIGSPVIANYPHVIPAFQGLHKQYGSIFTVGLGPYRSVVIGDYEILKDVFRLDATTDRPPMWQFLNQYFRYGNGQDSRGIVFSENEEWKEQRRFTLRILKDFGYGTSSMEGLIHEEVEALNCLLEEKCDKVMSMKNTFNLSTVNALWTLVTGERWALDDPNLIDLVETIDRTFVALGTHKTMNGFPWLRHIAPKASGWLDFTADVYHILGYVEKIMNPHVEHYNTEAPPSNYMEAYLQQRSTSKPGSSFYGQRGLESLRSCILDLMLAGSETTSSALNWSILLLIKYPTIQQRVQNELDTACGTRLPTVEDRPNLPFTDAVIHEIMRFTCLAPIGVPHYVRQDVWTSDRKYLIPAGTTVFPNLYQITHNHEVFERPHEFRPERFLDQNNKFVKHDHNLVFGTGKRDCLGKSLGQTQHYLFLTGILQKFNFKSTLKNLQDLSTEPRWGGTLATQPFEVIIEKRRI